jgi:phospholipase/lecithinase/hemolysin
VVRQLACDFETILLPTNRVMSEAAERLGAATVAYDGVHPTPLGHRLLADTWLASASAASAAQDVNSLAPGCRGVALS